jgi:transposase
MMCPVIDNTASCEIYTAIRFLHAKNMSAAEIHRKLCTTVYGQSVTSEGTVRQWYRRFKDERVNKCI